ncbi:MAG: PIN domain-containing protein [Candidatus Paracaedibacteraceae bacterium]|nr:PIN domain-containing protein [Candidatus Paracaedibacteraceae bacterium]
MSKVILDTSALLALIKNEPGASTVEDLLGQIVMSTLSLSEAATTLLQSGMTRMPVAPHFSTYSL